MAAAAELYVRPAEAQMRSPQVPPWFWELIESVGPEALRNDTEALEVRFRAMTRRRLLAFFRQFMRASGYVNPVNRSGFQSREGNLSEDAGADFAAWVVCRGRAFWARLRPASFQRYLDEYCQPDPWNVRPDNAAGRIFQERFGEEVFDLLRKTK
jgi:hypothetical protein